MKQDDKWKLASLSDLADRPLANPTGRQVMKCLHRYIDLPCCSKGTADKLTDADIGQLECE